MTLLNLLLIPISGLLSISVYNRLPGKYLPENCLKQTKFIGLLTSVLNLFISLIIFIKIDFACNQYQFVQKYHNLSNYDFYLGTDGLSIYFILLTCIIIPISLLSNWNSVSKNVKSYVIILLLLETFLLLVFLVLDILLYYIFFESILFPLFILVGLYGSSNKVRASFYLFLYTLIGSLFLLLSIINMYTITGVTDFDSLFKTNFDYYFQFFIFYGIFLSFAVKTPTIFLNNWLLKAHVESPLGGSLILASVVLKLSLYGILRLILPILSKAYLDNTYVIYIIGVVTIIYASFGTLRTIDVKELIAYSSVSHAAVYFLGVFSNNIQGIEGAIIFGLAHGFVSSGLFICAGGVLYDRSGNRLITIYRGLTQIMPIFSILFFILCLANAGAPLTFNFLGEFMCLYGTFERLPLLGIFASTSVILSASYSIYMLNRVIFGGSLSKFFIFNISDINRREFFIVFVLIIFTIFFGIYPAPILDGLHYYVTALIYNFDYSSDNLMFFFHIFFKKNKASTRIRIFNKTFLFKVLLIFVFSLASRSFINYVYDTNVFKEYTSLISLFYYSFLAFFVGFINELYIIISNYHDFNKIPMGGYKYGTNHTIEDLYNKVIANKADRSGTGHDTSSYPPSAQSQIPQQVGSSSQSSSVYPNPVVREQSPFNAIKADPEIIKPEPYYEHYPVLSFPTGQRHIKYDPFLIQQRRIHKIPHSFIGSMHSPENPTHLPYPDYDRRVEIKIFLDKFKETHKNDNRFVDNLIKDMSVALRKIEDVYGKRASYGLSTELKKIILNDPILSNKYKSKSTGGILWNRLGINNKNFVDALTRY